MSKYSLSHLSDQTLLSNLATLVSRDRATTAELLAHIAEVDSRKLYLPAACPSMVVYCERVLRLTRQAAYKRIRVARAAREFPAIFPALADGRLHLRTVMKLAPHLTEETADDLLAAGAGKSDPEIDQLLAQRFPQPDVPTRLQPVVIASDQLSARIVDPCVLGHVEAPSPHAKVAPLSPRRFALQVTLSQEAHDLLRQAQELLGHRVRSNDVAQVIERALQALVKELEKTKFAATSKPGRGRRASAADGRDVPAEVLRAVWARDGGQCTFVSDTGQRCVSRFQIEFDHIHPVARGGQATVDNLRLRCRAHNQYEAERTFGVAFMADKRQKGRGLVEARTRRGAVPSPSTAAPLRSAARAIGDIEPRSAPQATEEDVTPWLRKLGFRADEARWGAEACQAMAGASFEDRLRAALASLAPAHRRIMSHLQPIS